MVRGIDLKRFLDRQPTRGIIPNKDCYELCDELRAVYPDAIGYMFADDPRESDWIIGNGFALLAVNLGHKACNLSPSSTLHDFLESYDHLDLLTVDKYHTHISLWIWIELLLQAPDSTLDPTGKLERRDLIYALTGQTALGPHFPLEAVRRRFLLQLRIYRIIERCFVIFK